MYKTTLFGNELLIWKHRPFKVDKLLKSSFKFVCCKDFRDLIDLKMLASSVNNKMLELMILKICKYGRLNNIIIFLID